MGGRTEGGQAPVRGEKGGVQGRARGYGRQLGARMEEELEELEDMTQEGRGKEGGRREAAEKGGEGGECSI